MVMTDEQRYSAVLRELGEVLQDKNTTISCQKWQIDELKAKLEKAEAELENKTEHLVKCATSLAEARAEIEVLKGGAA